MSRTGVFVLLTSLFDPGIEGFVPEYAVVPLLGSGGKLVLSDNWGNEFSDGLGLAAAFDDLPPCLLKVGMHVD